MSVSSVTPVSGAGSYAPADPAKSTFAAAAAGTDQAEKVQKVDTYVKSSAGSAPKTKGLSADQMKEIQDQQLLSFKKMLYSMLKTQGDHGIAARDLTINKDLFSRLNITAADSAKAAEAISADGEWGVNAVATRIMDMAVALSGGDTEKLGVLKDAVEKGFKAAGAQWGGQMPSITAQTHDEIFKRFDYWEKNGSLEGYSMDE